MHLRQSERPASKEVRMPYTPEHKRETRQKILESARRLFNRSGFAAVSIGDVMRHAGLTHGGFYRHFTDKEELYAEAVRWFLCTEAPKPWQRKPKSAARRKPRGQRVVDAYFSRDHFGDRESCCPLIALPSDVARGGEAVKGAYREVLEKLADILHADLDGPKSRERALAIIALCVGGIVAARSVDDPALAGELRRAAHRFALRTGGWVGDDQRERITPQAS
jgi:TetR/AcrR family transcriptional regulator, transcriptional repressor for nem operon